MATLLGFTMATPLVLTLALTLTIATLLGFDLSYPVSFYHRATLLGFTMATLLVLTMATL